MLKGCIITLGKSFYHTATLFLTSVKRSIVTLLTFKSSVIYPRVRVAFGFIYLFVLQIHEFLLNDLVVLLFLRWECLLA